MDFPNAIRAVINNKIITRQEWGNGDYCLLQDGWLRIFTTKDEKFHDWLINDGDMLASDWIVVKEQN